MIKRKKKVKDDYGWFIFSKDAQNAAERLEKILGIPHLLDSIVRAMDQDEFARFLDDVIADNDLEEDISNLNEDGGVNWKTAYETMEEIIEIIGVENIYNELIRWMDYNTLADILAYICRVEDIEIPELVKDDDEDNDKDDDFTIEGVYHEIKDGLWIEPDNNATSAGHLTPDPAVRYKEYTILKREDGLYDVYTKGSFDLVGTEFKSLEEARKNIDEGRIEKHEKTLPEEINEEEVEEVKESDEEYADPGKKYVMLEGHRFDRNADNTWKISRTPVGGRPGEQYTMKTALPSFDAAVKYWMENISTAIDKDRVIKAMEKLNKYRVTDSKPEGKAVRVIREDEDFWRPWGLRDWSEEELQEYKSEFAKKGYKDVILVENDGRDPNKTKMKDKKNPHICDYCLQEMESRGERRFIKKIDVDEMNEKESKCDWCKESGFDTLYEVKED